MRVRPHLVVIIAVVLAVLSYCTPIKMPEPTKDQWPSPEEL